MFKFIQTSLFCFSLLLSSFLMAKSITTVQAQTPAEKNIHIENAYSRITAPTVKVGAVFMEIENLADQDDVLLSASTPIAKTVETHISIMENNMMKMRHLKEGILLPAQQKTVLKPGDLHLMLMGLKKPLKLNQTYPLTLKFKNSKEITINVPVQQMSPEQSHDHHH